MHTRKPNTIADVNAARVIKKLAPGERGSVKLVRRYGSALLCVRYRESLTKGERYTTVELIVSRRPLQPHQEPKVLVPIGLAESALRQRACQLGAEWNDTKRAWAMPYSAAKRLNLLHRAIAKST